MSGPKSSRYTLSAEQIKRLIEEQERERKALEEKARKERESKEALKYLSDTLRLSLRYLNMIKDQYSKFSKLVKEDSSDITESFHHLNSQIQKLNLICSIDSYAEHSRLLASKSQAEKLLKQIVSECEELFQKSEQAIVNHRIENDRMISEGMGLSFASVGVIEKETDPSIPETIASLERLLLLHISDDLQYEIISAMEKFNSINDPNARQNFTSITIEPLRKKCEAFDRFYKMSFQEYSFFLDKYKAMCEQLSEEEKEFDFSESGLAELKQIVTQYEYRILRSAEQEYISSTIDEVMKEMGYDVIGHRQVKKRTGKTFSSKLLNYADGTVINVTESSDGQITMEIGGVDDSDREPDENERIALQKNMESFCEDFKNIEQKLADRGVLLDTRLSMAPPDEVYAQIINYTDYTIGDSQSIVLNKNKQGSAAKRISKRDD